MRIQAKLFFLLVIIAVLPLVALSWRSQVATERLGMAIADRGRTVVAAQFETQLHQAVSLGTTILFQEQRLVELTLRVQAAEVERRLANRRPRNPGAIYFSSDFDDRSKWPVGTVLSTNHQRLADDGTREPVAISNDHQSFFIPSGIDQNTVAPDLLRLATMSEQYRRLATENQRLIFSGNTRRWQAVFIPYIPDTVVILKPTIPANVFGTPRPKTAAVWCGPPR